MEQVRWISKYTHKMARTLGVTVIGLSQVTVPADAPDKWVPTLESLRESKQLKNDADVVFLLYLHKQSQRDGVRWISVAKNKMGRLGRMAMEFDGDRQWFSVTKPPPDDPPPPAKGKKAPQYTQPPAVEDIPDDDPRQEQIREVLKDAGW